MCHFVLNGLIVICSVMFWAEYDLTIKVFGIMGMIRTSASAPGRFSLLKPEGTNDLNLNVNVAFDQHDCIGANL